MIDFSKGHYKIYLYNDAELFNGLQDAFKYDVMIFKFLRDGDFHGCPYYIRIKKGFFTGGNTSGDLHVYDTDDMIIVDGYDMLKMKNGVLPETLFQM